MSINKSSSRKIIAIFSFMIVLLLVGIITGYVSSGISSVRKCGKCEGKIVTNVYHPYFLFPIYLESSVELNVNCDHSFNGGLSL